MKCKICGAESGKYPLCRTCNKKRETGEVIKCPKCQNWHLASEDCPQPEASPESEKKFLYELKSTLVTNTELKYLNCIKSVLPEGYLVQIQANLASFIIKTDGSRFQNELYRNVDFLITDLTYRPMVVIEINDQSHLSPDRRERDEKVCKICEEAGIPLIKLWTSYGVNEEYIRKRINEAIEAFPLERVSHFARTEFSQKTASVAEDASKKASTLQPEKKSGCYIATCVYGSYDCPQVWTLRRFRDNYLTQKWLGRIFIKIYYTASPIIVKYFGANTFFKALCQKPLDTLVAKLNSNGIENTPYKDLY